MHEIRKTMTEVVTKVLEQNGDNNPGTVHAYIERLYDKELFRAGRCFSDMLRFFEEMEYSTEQERRRIQQSSHRNPATAGSLGERYWIKIFEEILPQDFKVVQTGHILFDDGKESRQLDILILKPGYSPAFVNRGFYPIDSVAAGFECKVTLTTSDVRETVVKSKEIKELCRVDTGSIRQELNTPFIYGLLAMGHDLNNKSKPPYRSMLDALVDSSRALQHPRELLDLLVVPGEFCFNAVKGIDVFDTSNVDWGYQHVVCDKPYTNPAWNALGTFFARFLERLFVDRNDLNHLLSQFAFFGTPNVTSYYGNMLASNVLSKALNAEIAQGMHV